MTTTQSTRPSEPSERRKWDAGYAHGFDDNYIAPWEYPFYSPPFILGYLAGKADIDQLVEEADHARRNYGEYL